MILRAIYCHKHNTVYIVVVLNAMQVGLATDALNHDAVFQRACYSFMVFAIYSPMIAVGSVVVALTQEIIERLA